MSKLLITDSKITDIADAIRTKVGAPSGTKYTLAQMATVIGDIQTGIALTVADEGKVVSNGALVAQTSQNISANGTYDTTLKNEAVVNVPNSYSASDEGKVVSNGALVAQTAHAAVTQNGTIDTTLNNSVVVNVPSGGGSGDGSFVTPKHIDAISDSIFTSHVFDGIQFTPAQAFGTERKHWWGSYSSAQHWLQVIFEEAELINKIQFSNLWVEGSSRWQSKTVVFQGSNDQTTWVDLLTLTNLTVSETQETYNVNNSTKYMYYRFLCASEEQYYTGLGKIRLYGESGGGGGSRWPFIDDIVDGGTVFDVVVSGTVSLDTDDFSTNVKTFYDNYARTPKPTTAEYNVNVTGSDEGLTLSQFLSAHKASVAMEYYGNVYGNTTMINDLGLVLLGDFSLGGSASGNALSDSISNYSGVILQGIYSSQRTSSYNTSMLYTNPNFNKSYWAGMKDRNIRYDCNVTFTDEQTVSLDGNKQVIIYGIV